MFKKTAFLTNKQSNYPSQSTPSTQLSTVDPFLKINMVRLSSCLTATLAVAASFAEVASSMSKQLTHGDSVDFNTLLDGSLGYMPALWLVSHGALLELYDNISSTAKTAQELAVTTGITISISPQPSDTHRTSKESGAVLAGFIGGMLVPPIFNIIDSTIAGGLCKSLVNSAGAMASAVVGQEAGKTLYPEGKHNSTASGFEQGVIPGAFFGSIVGAGADTALSRTLCDRLVPGFEKTWKAATPGTVERISRVLNRGLREVLTEHSKGMNVDAARATQFASQLEETLRLADHVGIADALEHLNRELISQTAQLTKAVGRGAKGVSTPALNNLARLSVQTLSLGILPLGDGISFSPAPGSIGFLQTFTDQYTKELGFTKTVPGVVIGINRLSLTLNGLRDATNRAGDLLRSGSSGLAYLQLDGAADAAGELMSALPHLDLLEIPKEDPRESSTVAITSTHTERSTMVIVSTRTQNVQHHVTSTRTHISQHHTTVTAYRSIPLHVTATVYTNITATFS